MDDAFDYIKANGGIDTEKMYPYFGKDLGYCYYRASAVNATVTGLCTLSSIYPCKLLFTNYM